MSSVTLEEKQMSDVVPVASTQYQGVWCYAEQRRGQIVPTIYELLQAGRKLSSDLKEELVAVLVGYKVKAAAQDLIEHGADKVYVYDNPLFENFLDESYAKALQELVTQGKPNKLLIPASTHGRSLAARLAVTLGTGAVAEVTEIALDAKTKGIRATRSSYGGNVVSTLGCKDQRPELVTVRPMAFPKAEKVPGRQGKVVPLSVEPALMKSRVKFIQFVPEENGVQDIGTAEKIVSGGRGLGTPQGFDLIREFAKALGAAVGASRATVDAGWIPYRHQVGLTGRTVRPKLYVACGISGQIQHLAGMSSSEVIVAINTDPEAPLMKLATFSVQGDLYQVIPAIIAEIKKQRG
ncbi:MAG: electron transfer flavoprotein subunit alpha/FixB family protein [Elusimicrobia bacterium]|nr:electron transfer flavoprotein subunit alpha/FixB family protein [Elusimicrobiota bacterium]